MQSLTKDCLKFFSQENSVDEIRNNLCKHAKFITVNSHKIIGHDKKILWADLRYDTFVDILRCKSLKGYYNSNSNKDTKNLFEMQTRFGFIGDFFFMEPHCSAILNIEICFDSPKSPMPFEPLGPQVDDYYINLASVVLPKDIVNEVKTLFDKDEDVVRGFISNFAKKSCMEDLYLQMKIDCNEKELRIKISNTIIATITSVLPHYKDPKKLLEKSFSLVYVPALFGHSITATGTSLCIEGQIDIKDNIEPLLLINYWTQYAYAREIRIIRDYNATSTAISSLMARNMSHNIGSHSLASTLLQEVRENPKRILQDYAAKGWLGEEYGKWRTLDEDKKKIFRRAISTDYDHYLQGRQDFVSQVVEQSGSKNTVQPMFLWRDVLQPFTKQYALLATVLNDQGFGYAENSKPIGFTINFNGATFLELKEDEDFNTANGASVLNQLYKLEGKDRLVGIPGGAIGCHALYSILENILRNAVKYGGKRDGGKLILDFSLHDAASKDCYLLNIRENLSGGKFDSKVVKELRSYIKMDLLQKSGEMQTKGHGIQEMKACADHLAGKHQGFYPDHGSTNSNSYCLCHQCKEKYIDQHKECQAGENEDQKIKCNACDKDPKPCSCGYSEYIEKNSKVNLEEVLENAEGCNAWMDCEEKEKIRCFHDAKSIVYQLILQKPYLVGVVNKDKTKWEQESIHSFCSIKELTQNVPQIGVILAHSDNDDEISKTLTAIKENDQYLPFRLLIVRNNEKREKDEWTKVRNKHKIQWMRKRFCVVNNPNLWGKLSAKPDDDKWEDLALGTYLAWLKAFKPCPKRNDVPVPWKLVIGFNRDEASIAKKWTEQCSNLSEINGYVHVHILSKLEGENRILVASSCLDSARYELKDIQKMYRNNVLTDCTCDDFNDDYLNEYMNEYILYDNHGRALPVTDQNLEDASFYAKIGSSENIQLYQILENPPPAGFGFKWFILSIIESSLLDLAIFDERLASNIFQDNENINNFINATKPYRWQNISPLLYIKGKSKSRDILDHPNKIPTSGIDMTNREVLFPKVTEENGNIQFCDSKENPDALVFHLGLIEQAKNIIHTEQDKENLRSISQGVFVTTGRGGARSMNRFPLVDYASIHTGLLAGLNKLSLAQAILSGTVKNEGEK